MEASNVVRWLVAILAALGIVALLAYVRNDAGGGRFPDPEDVRVVIVGLLVSALAVNGRVGDARELFERLLGLTNDLGLLAEEYDVGRQRQVGNFPQAFSHLALINAAAHITAAG